MHTEILVIGAGPAGTVSASYLANAGYKVTILEKTVFPRFVIGESLLPQCMDSLEESGLLQGIDKNKYQIKSGATFIKDEQTCSFTFNEQYSKSHDSTYQVKRSEFDHDLVKQAQLNGVNVLFNSEVTKVKTGLPQQTTTFVDNLGKEQIITSNFIIDASGYGRVLPKLLQLNIPSDQKSRSAIFAHITDEQRSDSCDQNIVVHALNQQISWLWTIPFKDKTTSVGLIVDSEIMDDLTQHDYQKFKDFVKTYPGLKGRFKNSDFITDIKCLNGYSIGVKQLHGSGYVLCGNSTEFLDPIFSSGVTLACASALMSAKLVEQHLKGAPINWETEYDQKLNHAIDVFRSYINGWYDGSLQKIFFNHDIDQSMKEQICSVLAGHVWDTSNPFVKKHKTILQTLSKVIDIQQL